MQYESIEKLKVYMQKKINAIATGEQVKFNINAHQLLDELEELEEKAKKLEEIENIVNTELACLEEEEDFDELSERGQGQLDIYENLKYGYLKVRNTEVNK